MFRIYLFTFFILTNNLLFSSSACSHEFQILLDASGSMKTEIKNHTTRFKIAKKSVSSLLNSWPLGLNVGIIKFGSGHKKCSKPQRLLKIQPVPKFGFPSVYFGKPKNDTPLAFALEFSDKQFSNEAVSQTLVLITDGIDTCVPNFCERIKKYFSNLTQSRRHLVLSLVPKRILYKNFCFFGHESVQVVKVSSGSEITSYIQNVLRPMAFKDINKLNKSAATWTFLSGNKMNITNPCKSAFGSHTFSKSLFSPPIVKFAPAETLDTRCHIDALSLKREEINSENYNRDTNKTTSQSTISDITLLWWTPDGTGNASKLQSYHITGPAPSTVEWLSATTVKLDFGYGRKERIIKLQTSSISTQPQFEILYKSGEE